MLGLFLIGEREFPKYPQIPNEIKHNKKITYLINNNKMVLSLKVDEKIIFLLSRYKGVRISIN